MDEAEHGAADGLEAGFKYWSGHKLRAGKRGWLGLGLALEKCLYFPLEVPDEGGLRPKTGNSYGHVQLLSFNDNKIPTSSALH